jgi:hypothetical protein
MGISDLTYVFYQLVTICGCRPHGLSRASLQLTVASCGESYPAIVVPPRMLAPFINTNSQGICRLYRPKVSQYDTFSLNYALPQIQRVDNISSRHVVRIALVGVSCLFRDPSGTMLTLISRCQG